ncbi:MAG TPA: ABC transporter substrate-binding protein [Methanoculleus sp.]|nr:ABC transporter substrate-binding protein [Methanoculleus sp.]HOD85607.1 ABC transporter substrate-binding protein [Methanoculleus sp.]HOI60683.1 ABC transporter substrate-binding protein [Methanoculleus sp.]
MTILLALDDTDNLESRGTGRLARAVADAIAMHYPVWGVTRHQLYVHPSIPYTSHNSCAVIHIVADGAEPLDTSLAIAEETMLGDFVEGSDPGLAGAPLDRVAPALMAFGRDAQQMVLTQERARTLAKNLGIWLKGLGGTEDGVIGAMAGLGLAATYNDGRFLQKGAIRSHTGPTPASTLLGAGIDEIMTLDGRKVTEGTIVLQEGKAAKACPINGRAVLFVDDRDGELVAVKRN